MSSLPGHYSIEELLALRESPLITKPDSLPQMEQWMQPPIDRRAQAQIAVSDSMFWNFRRPLAIGCLQSDAPRPCTILYSYGGVMNSGLSRSQAHGSGERSLALFPCTPKKAPQKSMIPMIPRDVHKVRKYVLPSRRSFRLDFSLIGQI